MDRKPHKNPTSKNAHAGTLKQAHAGTLKQAHAGTPGRAGPGKDPMLARVANLGQRLPSRSWRAAWVRSLADGGGRIDASQASVSNLTGSDGSS